MVAAGLFMCYYSFLPQTYHTLIISTLLSYGIKIFPQFE